MNIGDVLGGFELRRVLGRGGFGTVYLGQDKDGQLAAVKVLHHHYADSAQFRARFEAEIEHSMRVVDFCIARVLAADPGGNPPWVATEYVEGPTLRQQVHSGEEGGGPLSEGDLYRIAVATATALTAIHASEVVHRDFTPSNIMVAPDGIRVIDFGIARALENSPVSASALLGTPRYMAPEQFLGNKVTPAIDVFAWGAVIAFAGTGRDIFSGENLAVTLRKVLFDKPDLTGLPDNLAAVVRWCLYKDPQLRPTSNRLLATLLGVEEPAGGHSTDLLATYGGRTNHDILTMGLQIGQGSRTIDISAIPAITPAPPDRDELFEFGGRSYSSGAALAQGMQRNWDSALSLLRNAPHRQDLLRWLPERQERARWIVGQLPEDWGGADVQAANLIVELDPTQAPLFDGLDMSWSALFSTREGRTWPYHGESHRRLIHLVEHANLLEPLSRHRCVGADHSCESDAGCAFYKQVARRTAVMFDTLRKCEAWLEQLGKGVGLAPSEIPPDDRGDLVHFLATSPLSELGRYDLAAWAVERIPKGPELDQVYRAVCNSDDPWAAAIAFRVHGDDFRELVERFEPKEAGPGRGTGTGAGVGTGAGTGVGARTGPGAGTGGLRASEPESALEPDRGGDPESERAPEPVLEAEQERERDTTERERLTEERDALKGRDPKVLVWFFYVLGATLVALAGGVVVVWDSMTVLAVVFAVVGLLFGVIGRLMELDHRKVLGGLDRALDALPAPAVESATRVEGEAGIEGAAEASGEDPAAGSVAGSVADSGAASGDGAARPPVRGSAAARSNPPSSEGSVLDQMTGGTRPSRSLVSFDEEDFDRTTSSEPWFPKQEQEAPAGQSGSGVRSALGREKRPPGRSGRGRVPVGLDADAYLAERGPSRLVGPGPDTETTEDLSLEQTAARNTRDSLVGEARTGEPPVKGKGTGKQNTEGPRPEGPRSEERGGGRLEGLL